MEETELISVQGLGTARQAFEDCLRERWIREWGAQGETHWESQSEKRSLRILFCLGFGIRRWARGSWQRPWSVRALSAERAPVIMGFSESSEKGDVVR